MIRSLLPRRFRFPRRKLHYRGGGYDNLVPRGRGVNLVGLPRAESGLGEHVRGVARALRAADVPFAVLDHRHTHHPQTDVTLAAEIVERPRHPTNLFCLNFDAILERWRLEPSLFAGRYNVGYGFWEASELPDPWCYAMNVLDEVWAPSRHVLGVVAGKSSVPVVLMPLAVEVAPRPSDRPRFGLPADRFLIVSVFDLSSTLARKNPAGAIAAFRRAFPRGDEPVGLVLKTKTNPDRPDQIAARDELAGLVGEDERVRWIDARWQREELLTLLASCDALLSLHRAEGFGLAIAEAMALGKPVVVTGYSGNLEFTRPGTACLVPYRLVAIAPGEVFGLEGGSAWADPDLDAAATFLAHLAGEPEDARRLGESGQRVVTTELTDAVVGRSYRQRLRSIGLL